VTALEDLGWSEALAKTMPPGARLRPARVTSVYSARVEVWGEDGVHLAAVRGRAKREGVEGGIAVGDWVALAPSANDDVVVEHVLPRRTAFLRQAAGERSEPQAICANVDVVFVVTSIEGDFNARRLERYVVAIRSGGALAEIVLAKADLGGAEKALEEARALAPAIATSARTGEGIAELRARIAPNTTVALVGSSGVGKSALVNVLLGHEAQAEGAVRAHDKRGRHTTTRRALFVVPGGGLLVDTPGMRELKPWLPDDEVEEEGDAFADVLELAGACRYRDCRHEAEPGCAILGAVASGALAPERLASFHKLAAERAARAKRQAGFADLSEKRRARAYTTAQRRDRR
jgi:ribosome biogenesis GTPase